MYQTNQAVSETFYLIDPADDAPESGKVNADWTKQAYKNGATNAATVTITELSGGVYKMVFTPDAVGDWHATASVAVGTTTVYHEFGPWQVEAYDMDGLQAVIGANSDTTGVNTLFGWLLRLRCFFEKKAAISGTTLTHYDTDNTTALVNFTLSPDAVAPTSRTPA